ncbi:hypothetical protein RFI_04113, partial [Reticulomyxa filosa]
MSQQQVQLKQQQKKEKLMRFNLNDDRWKNFDLKSGDEILCEYSFESNSSGLRVDKIEFPVLYQGEVNEDDDSQFALVQVHCTKPVLLHTTSIYHDATKTKVKLVNDGQKKKNGGLKIKWSSVVNIAMTHGLLLISKSFNEPLRLAFFKKKDFRSQHVHIRRIGDIKAAATVKNKQEKVSHILSWLGNPSEGTIKFIIIFFFGSKKLKKIDQNEYKDINVSDLIDLYKDQYNCSSHGDENSNKLQWLKTYITVEAMKYVAKECMIEACSIPNELVEPVIRNLKCCSEVSSMMGSNSISVSNSMSSLKAFIEKYHNTNEEDDLTNLQTELEHIEALPILIEQQTVDNMYWV